MSLTVREIHASSRPSLQARVLAAARRARAEVPGFARSTPGAFPDTPASTLGAVPPMIPALSIGYLGTPDRSDDA